MEKTNPCKPSIIEVCTQNITPTANGKKEEKKVKKYFYKWGAKYLAPVGVWEHRDPSNGR